MPTPQPSTALARTGAGARDAAASVLAFEIGGNSLLRWLIAAGVTLAAFALVALVRRLATVRLARLAPRTPTPLDDLAVAVIRRTRLWLWVVPALWCGGFSVDLPGRVDRYLGNVAVVALLLQAGLCAMAFVDFWADRYRRERLAVDPASTTTFGAVALLAKVVAWSLVLVLALDNLGFSVTTLVTGLGIGGVALALATQNILADLFSSLSIVADKPFEVGDTITVGDLTGRVEKIGIKTTRLRAVSGEQLVFSNGDLLGSRIRNWRRLVERRVLLVVGVRYDTTPEQLEAIPGMVREAVEAQLGARFERAHFRGFGPSTLDVEAVYWIESSDYQRFMDVQQAVNLALLRRFAAEGIGMAYPTQTLHVETLPSPRGAGAAALEGQPSST